MLSPSSDISCTGNSDCYIDCSSSFSCKDAVIDASTAQSLVIYCYSDYACENSVIICPAGTDSICTIEVSGGSYSYILYNAVIYAETTNELNIKCSTSYSCYGNSFYANNSNNVSIECGAYACYSQNYFYVQNVQTVNLNAYGECM